MNKLGHILCILIFSVMTNTIHSGDWGKESTSENGRIKQRINFSGILITQQGKTYSVDNIAIGRMYKQIKFYEMPQPSADHKLTKNPAEGIISNLDLTEIKELRIPHADQIWGFQRNPGGETVKYIEIEVISNDAKKTKNSYLIDTKRNISCDRLNDAGPIEMDVPFNALKTLVINGYNNRDTDKNKPSITPTVTMDVEE